MPQPQPNVIVLVKIKVEVYYLIKLLKMRGYLFFFVNEGEEYSTFLSVVLTFLIFVKIFVQSSYYFITKKDEIQFFLSP